MLVTMEKQRILRFLEAQFTFEPLPIAPLLNRDQSNCPAAFPRNRLPSRMYRLMAASEAWPVCCLIRWVAIPARAADVTKPARSECPENFAGSKPILIEHRLLLKNH